LAKEWLLVGDGKVSIDDRFVATVSVPAGTTVDLWLGGEWFAAATGFGDYAYFDVNISHLPVGRHEALFVRAGAGEAFAVRSIVRSYPLYVVVSNDWDNPNQEDDHLRRAVDLRKDHPELVLTHFVGPYTFTEPQLPEGRAEELVNWLLDMREQWGDEIGLHVHPYCSFVEEAAVSCQTSPVFGTAQRDPSGYLVPLTVYSEEETAALFRTADRLFLDWGLGKPTSFRAGAWAAQAHTLWALARTGYLVDSSAVNWHRLEEWAGVPGVSVYDWNAENWAGITETSQPYYPSVQAIDQSGDDFIPILELPDNGALVDYVGGDEMIEMFEANWNGAPLHVPRAYSIGYHPDSFSESFARRLDEALTHIDGFLAVDGNGPAVYARVSDMVQVWPLP
jgi:hypothetical protein